MDLYGHLKPTFISLALLALAGCSTLPGSDLAPAADSSRTSIEAWQYTQTDAAAVSQITDLVSSTELDALVAQALQQNPGLQQTALALQIARANRQISAAERLPSAALGLSESRAEDTDTSYNANVSISWELDLWHKLGDGVSAAEMEFASSSAELQAARDLLSASVMQAWLDIVLRRQLITIETERLAILESNETLITQRYRSGLGDLEALDNARSNSASTRSTLAGYRQDLASSERSLQQLLGLQGLQAQLPQAREFPQVITPLAALPDQDLARRPDLQQAYYNILAAGFRSEVAYKELLPSFNLSAALSDLAASPADALLTSPAWSLLGQITAPLFQGGRLRAAAEVARLSAEQQFYAYQQTLLTAVTEVNNALGQEQALQQQQQHLSDALASARRSATSYESKYRQGLVDILDLLTVQQQAFNLQAQLTQITYQRLANRIDLGLALGLGVTS
ncbi:MAG: TolC family protein [Gammaproteobacteria bacterium]|uniref:TolC family protein n=1 Tax=Pseudomaricurvus alcaniphilus TaxID=1166482 RepID=UPI001408B0CE|nr:TolC family protein [Pseudomaricurvus alcaniphilus]MBR9910130.1 TolC family protein [Gammaproteobacteria bacterium]NHN36647.1 TolC family protein [Pseudomaricurvus alcaniphilus]